MANQEAEAEEIEGLQARVQAELREPGPTLSAFRKPDKYHIGEDVELFSRRIAVWFDVVGLKGALQKRAALLLNLSENAFRIAEPLTLETQGTEDEQFGNWIGELRKLFEKNQSPVERRFHFTRRIQMSDESVDSFTLGMREIAAKCQFLPAELQSRLIDHLLMA